MISVIVYEEQRLKENYDLIINIQGESEIPEKLFEWTLKCLEEARDEIVTGLNPVNGEKLYTGGRITISKMETYTR